MELRFIGMMSLILHRNGLILIRILSKTFNNESQTRVLLNHMIKQLLLCCKMVSGPPKSAQMMARCGLVTTTISTHFIIQLCYDSNDNEKDYGKVWSFANE